VEKNTPAVRVQIYGRIYYGFQWWCSHFQSAFCCFNLGASYASREQGECVHPNIRPTFYANFAGVINSEGMIFETSQRIKI
jgi:hypothetical protein